GGARAAAAPLDRYWHGPGAHGGHPPGRRQRFRDRSFPPFDRSYVLRSRAWTERADRRLLPGHRGPFALVGFSRLGRRAAVERRPGLRIAADHAPRHAPRAASGSARAVDASPGL